MPPERHRLLLDQMLKVQVAELLQADGHDAVRVSELGLARADDSEILQRAIESDRILLTVDGDFGDWAVLPLETHPGVVRVRVHPPTSEGIISILRPLLRDHPPERFADHLIIASPGRIKWIPTARTSSSTPNR